MLSTQLRRCDGLKDEYGSLLCGSIHATAMSNDNTCAPALAHQLLPSKPRMSPTHVRRFTSAMTSRQQAQAATLATSVVPMQVEAC
mmetsp:Transcript_8789/g.26036  ORF Transcript_8789/g.26036 Transcript_8789/m.26036 type:complete len:86 (+) Transcript_8789:655-912(+)